MSESDAELEFGEDAAWVAAALVLVAALGGAVVLAEWPLWGVQVEAPEEPHLVEPVEGGTQLWPYTARAHSYESRTLGVNIIIYGDPDDVHTALTERSELGWEDGQIHEGDADSDTVSDERVEIDAEAEDFGEVISWRDAEGSERYTYFESGGGGKWAGESYQLHAGTYLGERRHIRAYDEPAEEWTAIQIHEEHWDWFRLRHTVTGMSDSQRELESEFMREPSVETVVRMPFENGTADSDGWVTGIHLAGAVLPFFLFGIASRTRDFAHEAKRFLGRRQREISLGVGLFALYTAVRWLGIVGEIAFSSVSPKLVAAPLYVALVLGTPAIAYVFAKGSDEGWAFTFAALGLGGAILIDYAAMGVSVLPIRVILHRGAVLLSVGLIAIGGATIEDETRPRPLLIGAVGWVLAIVAPVFGYM